MKIILSNMITIMEPTKEIRQWVTKNLSINNPEFYKKQAMGYSTYKTPRYIKLYDDYEGNLYIPMGCFDDLFKLYPHIEDYRDYTTSRKINIVGTMKLRDYQEPCIKAVEDHHNTILNLPCGTGKTLSATACVCHLKERTLWLAHTIDLVNQAKDTFEKFTTAKTSLITNGKCDMSGDVVFATVQSVLKFIKNGTLKQDDFGMVVIDECQHISANPKSIQIFRTCFEYFNAKYKVGLTATIHRADGLASCILKIIGFNHYSIVQDKDTYNCMYDGKCLLSFPTDKFQVPCHVKVIQTNYNVWDKDVFSVNGGTLQFASMVSDISNDKNRNDMILRDLKKVKGSTIILSDRVEQLKYLSSHLTDSVEIDGGTPKKERERALNDVREGKKKYLFASYQLAKEGLDCPILANVIMATPVKDFAVVVQSIGRIQRPYAGKNIAYVYDYVDNVAMLRKYFENHRKNIYKKNGWKIDNILLSK